MAHYDCGPNSVAWSGIGDSDFTIRADENTAGYMHMPWEGVVFKVKRLGDVVMVYGSGGLAALFPVTEPEPTYGRKDLKGSGIPSRNCVCGDHLVHYYLDQLGSLWAITGELNPKELGYREFLGELDLSKTVMTYERAEGDVYISDGERSFLFSENGLSEIGKAFTSIHALNGILIGHSFEVGDEGVFLETNIVDMGLRVLKTISVIALGVGADEKVEVRVKWRRGKKDEWRESAWRRTNDEGFVTMPFTGTEFTFQIRSSQYIDLDYLTVRYKVTDKRAIRGIYHDDSAAS